MEITIDTKNKTVELKEDTNIFELADFLEDAVGDEWEEYKILATKVNKEYVPYYPCPCPTPIQPCYPFNPLPNPLQPYYITTTSDTKL